MPNTGVAKTLLRVVLLHGFMHTNENIRIKGAEFEKAYSEYLDVKYVVSPHLLTEPPGLVNEYNGDATDEQVKVLEQGAKQMFLAFLGSREHYGNTWYFTEKPGECSLCQKHAEVIGLEESIKVIIDGCKEHEADGVIGFSQGGLMAVLAAQRAMQDDSLGWKPKFVMLINAAMTFNENLRKLADAGNQLNIPSLHVVTRVFLRTTACIPQ
ncbi:hypothetical protein BgAZ_500720 [Babesia gibsoni]|uniref:Serine hydrolase domain-containing protein n=1 Tax=Babesia gibsoni TaxID=33632 RepID=A0AAD8LFQ2_BABGI|nr:hypothetical protein BgAZ_500720 [Babesia gibsoni]